MLDASSVNRCWMHHFVVVVFCFGLIDYDRKKTGSEKEWKNISVIRFTVTYNISIVVNNLGRKKKLAAKKGNQKKNCMLKFVKKVIFFLWVHFDWIIWILVFGFSGKFFLAFLDEVFCFLSFVKRETVEKESRICINYVLFVLSEWIFFQVCFRNLFFSWK